MVVLFSAECVFLKVLLFLRFDRTVIQCHQHAWNVYYMLNYLLTEAENTATHAPHSVYSFPTNHKSQHTQAYHWSVIHCGP